MKIFREHVSKGFASDEYDQKVSRRLEGALATVE